MLPFILRDTDDLKLMFSDMCIFISNYKNDVFGKNLCYDALVHIQLLWVTMLFQIYSTNATLGLSAMICMEEVSLFQYHNVSWREEMFEMFCRLTDLLSFADMFVLLTM